jgi:hypothetical protein
MTRRGIALVLSVAALAGTAACARGGPGVSGPEALNLFRSYSGTWVLDEGWSSDVPALADGSPGFGRAGPEEGGGGRGGGVIGGRGGAGVPGGFGGRGGGGFPGRGPVGPVDPEAMRATFALARTRPSTIRLDLSDSLFAADYEGGLETNAPMSGDEVDLDLNGRPARVRVAWKDAQPRLTWRVAEGGQVTDRFELLATGRLMITRVYSGGGGSAFEARFVYTRRQAAAAP